jgi:Carboxypeptidase regulatory-like domain
MSPILGLVLLWLTGAQVRPASRPDAESVRGSIEGVVTRAGAADVAARQLSGAIVELKPGNTSVTTDASGAFIFRNLVPGRYTISVKRDGFIPQEDRSRGLTTSGLNITLGPGLSIKNLELPMTPAPVLAGKVFDPRGEPLAAALVRAYTRQYTPLGTQLKIVRKGMSNDLGEFRLFGLNFGEYFVSAGYSDRDRATAVGNTQLSENVSKADDGYATMFYDGAEEISRALPTRLVPGFDSATLSILLRDSARFKIRGRVLPIVSNTRIAFAPKGGDLTEADFFTEPNANGDFEIRAVSPGSYLLLATTGDGAYSSDVIAVNVTDSDIDGLRFALEPTISVFGGVLTDRSITSYLSGLRIKLVRSTAEFDQTIEALMAPGGAFTLQHVAQTAEYDVVVEPVPPGVYVKSITAGGRNLLQGKSRLVPNQPIQIALAAATDELEVHVKKGSSSPAGVQVVLLPEPLLRRRADRYITGFTGESGDVVLTVPPGRYTAYAFEQIERGAYYVLGYSPSSGDRFRDRAVSVVIPGTKSIELQVIPIAETAGGLQ